MTAFFDASKTPMKQTDFIKDAIAELEKNPGRLKSLPPRVNVAGRRSLGVQRALSNCFDPTTVATAKALAKSHLLSSGQVVDLAVRDHLARMSKRTVHFPAHPIPISKWKSTDTGTKVTECRLFLYEAPLGTCVFVDASIMFAGITKDSTSKRPFTSPECASFLTMACAGKFSAFTTTYEIARVETLLRMFARTPFSEHLKCLALGLNVLGVDSEDLVHDEKNADSMSVNAALSVFVKAGIGEAVATVSTDFDSYISLAHRAPKGRSRQERTTIYVPHDLIQT